MSPSAHASSLEQAPPNVSFVPASALLSASGVAVSAVLASDGEGEVTPPSSPQAMAMIDVASPQPTKTSPQRLLLGISESPVMSVCKLGPRFRQGTTAGAIFERANVE